MDHLITARAGTRRTLAAIPFIERNTTARRLEVPPFSAHLGAAITVAEGYSDDGKGIAATGAMNMTLATAHHTDALQDRRNPNHGIAT